MDNDASAADGLIRCSWGDSPEPDYRAYHDREWGVPSPRRAPPVRAAGARGCPGRPLVVDDPAQARRLPARVRGLRRRDGRRLRRGGRRAAHGRRGDRAQPGQDRLGDRQRAGDARRCRPPDRASWTICGRSWAASRSSTPGRRSAAHPAETDESRAMSRDLQGARLSVRRTHDLLRADAVGRARQRPRRDLLPIRGGQDGGAGLSPASLARMVSARRARRRAASSGRRSGAPRPSTRARRRRTAPRSRPA